MRRRVRAIGEPVVPLTDKYPLAVTFIIGRSRLPGGAGALAPIGTGFILNVPARFKDLYFEYVVTASHVVEGRDETYARIRTRDGGSKDLPVHEWVHHPTADVAVAPFDASGHEDLHLLNVPAAALGQRPLPRWDPQLGDRVYFLGLPNLPAAQGMIARNVPMVRSGTIGAMYQDDVPVQWPDGSIRKVQAHLIDCRSYGGFSGSPCFFQRDDAFTAAREGKLEWGQITRLFGLVSGHFDLATSPLMQGDIAELGSIRVPVNTGVGIVTPDAKIVEVLEMEELREERERVTEEHRKKQAEEGATLDTTSEVPEEYERFEELARKVVNTPKSEIDEKRKRDS